MITKTQLRRLKTLIEAEPYVSLPDDDAIKAALEAKTVVEHRPVAIGEAQRVLMESGEWWGIRALSGTNQWAGMAIDLLTARFDSLNVFSSATQQALAGLVADGLISADSRAEIEQMGTEYRSPAQAAGLGAVVRSGWFDRARAI